MEEKMAQIKEKVRKLESECIQAIGKAQEKGKEEVMGEVTVEKVRVMVGEVPEVRRAYMRDKGV